MHFWNLFKLTAEDFDEISHLKKVLSLDDEQALFKWMEKNPGKVENMGSMNEEGKFEQEIIHKDGVKTNTDFAQMLKDVIERNKK